MHVILKESDLVPHNWNQQSDVRVAVARSKVCIERGAAQA